MPKTEKTVRDPWDKWKGMVLAAKERLDMSDEAISERLVRQLPGGPVKPSRQMVTHWRKNPDLMPLWAFARINRILEIEAEEARKTAVVWR